MNQPLEQQFELLVANMMRVYGYTAELGQRRSDTRFHLDLVFNKGDKHGVAEIKFYRSRGIDLETLERAAAQLNNLTTGMDVHRFLVTGAMVTPTIKEYFLKQKGVIVWDRSNVFNFTWALPDPTLMRQFEELLLTAQQGTSIGRPFDEVKDTPKNPDEFFQTTVSSATQDFSALTKGATLSKELDDILVGKPGATGYERKCVEVLQYLFDGDLTTWDQQVSTDDGLSRFDLICRIVARNDFWISLIQSFNTRFILFECKNYSAPITQAQVYMTERYLYPKALRSVAIIIARNEATEHALMAAKGALREHGKLILFLSNADLKQMLIGRDAGNSPNDYLGQKVDDFLLTISR
jgi:hypothetical protein